MQKRAYVSNFEVVFDKIGLDDTSTIRLDVFDTVLPREPVSFLHYHDKLELGICTDGRGIIYDAEEAESISCGDIMLFLSGSAHYSQSIDPNNPCKCRFAFIDAEELLFKLFCDKRRGNELMISARERDIPSILRKADDPEIYAILHTMMQDIMENGDRSELLAALDLSRFLIKAEAIYNPSLREARKVSDDGTVTAVEAFIATHYYESINTERLCGISYLSESQLRRRFKKAYGTSPMQYLHRLRCKIGERLLRNTDLSVLAVSSSVGYVDVSDFYRHFVAIYKAPPSSIRGGAGNNS